MLFRSVILLFLLVNPIVMYLLGPGTAGWLLIAEFIFTLAMALKCYPLLPGGLLAVEALLIGLTTPDAVYLEVLTNFPVILLLMFMVAGIYFMKELLLVTFTQILVGVRSKSALSLLFCGAAAVLSAFLDALTVTAVIISVAVGFYSVYHKVASGKGYHHNDHNAGSDDEVVELHREDLENFRAFMRSLLMHGAIGTALGGVATMVGEPQNLLIAKVVGWDFADFFLTMAPVSITVLFAGLSTCWVLEKLRWFGYGGRLPKPVRRVLEEFAENERSKRTKADQAALWVQAFAAAILVIGLAKVGGWAELMEIVRATPANEQGDSMASLVRSHNDPDFPWTGVFLGSAIIGFWYWCTDQFIVQRVLSGRDMTQARRGTIFGAYLKMTPVFIFSLYQLCFHVLLKLSYFSL